MNGIGTYLPKEERSKKFVQRLSNSNVTRLRVHSKKVPSYNVIQVIYKGNLLKFVTMIPIINMNKDRI